MNIPNKKISDGNEIPVLGLGTWKLKGEDCVDVVRRALDLGYRHIDTAEIYGNQKEIGAALETLGIPREKLFLTSKVWPDNASYEETINSVEKTLRELRTDYLDLILIHWPSADIPVSETLRAFRKLFDGGKVKSVGVSNFDIPELKEALKVSESLGLKISVNQVKFYPGIYQEQKNLLEFCNENGILITAYSPLNRGNVLENGVVNSIAGKYNVSASQISLAWILGKGFVVIPKASSEKHLKGNLDSLNLKLLMSKDVEKIDSIKD